MSTSYSENSPWKTIPCDHVLEKLNAHRADLAKKRDELRQTLPGRFFTGGTNGDSWEYNLDQIRQREAQIKYIDDSLRRLDLEEPRSNGLRHRRRYH